MERDRCGILISFEYHECHMQSFYWQKARYNLVKVGAEIYIVVRM